MSKQFPDHAAGEDAPLGQGDRTRAKILDAAVEIIDERGEAALRVVDVGQRAGVAVASIYTYFINRDDLVESARIEQYLGSVSDDLERLAAVMEQVDTPQRMMELLQEVSRAAADPQRADRRWRRAEVLGAARKRPRLAARVAQQQHETTEEMRRIVEVGQQRGLLDPTLDPLAVAVFVQAYTFGLVLAEVDPDSGLDQDGWLAVVARFTASITNT